MASDDAKASSSPDAPAPSAPNFIADVVTEDLAAGRNERRVFTRFPPEPNGYLHLGHAKSICLNFQMAARGKAEGAEGRCNLRFDDTNPTTEDVEYVESIKADVRWLGFEWDGLYFASDYFPQLYAWAERFITEGKAYVDSQTLEEIRENRGSFYKPGTESPFRNRTVEENLDLFRRMRAGEFPDGAHVLRAKGDMAHTNINLRDPLMYRIKHAHHHRTGDQWCIYPTYDWAHGQSDAIEGITHSLCTLEFEDHRPLYDWFLDQVAPPRRPRQIEFAKLLPSFTVLSKRRLKQMVDEKIVEGWDDPRMPTLAGMRRRGFTPEALRNFCERVGVSKREGMVDVTLLEHALREHLNATSPRVFAVLRPLKVVIENLPEGTEETFDGALNPEDPSAGSRPLRLTREIYIEQDDFREDAPKKWFRLSPGREVRLRYACIIKCHDVIKNAAGQVTELRCTWDPASRGGNAPDGRKIQGTLHWVSARHGIPAQVRLYDRLFTVDDPLDEKTGGDFRNHLNPASLEVLSGSVVEPYLGTAAPGSRWQFERLGYFCADSRAGRPGAPVFNRTISLRDSWSKLDKGG
jgi:glutaminyl-tRNA synthetase